MGRSGLRSLSVYERVRVERSVQKDTSIDSYRSDALCLIAVDLDHDSEDFFLLPAVVDEVDFFLTVVG